MCSLPLSTLRTYVVHTRAGPVHGVPVSVSPYEHQLIQRGFILLVSSVISGSSIILNYFLSPYPCDSIRPEGRHLMDIYHLGWSFSRSLILCIMSDCGALYLFPLL